MTIERFAKIGLAEVRAALRRCFPEIDAPVVEYVHEGWDFWIFSAGELLFRFPKHEKAVAWLERERQLLNSIATLLPVAVPRMELHCTEGPNDTPFVGYRRSPGVALASLDPCETPGFGRAIGLFLCALHALALARLADLDLPRFDADRWRAHNRELCTQCRDAVFPLLGPAARLESERRFAAFLDNDANFYFTSVLIHADLWEENVIVDPASRALTGVIDFAECQVGDPAFDLASVLPDGGTSRLAAAVGPAGLADLHAVYPYEDTVTDRCRYYQFTQPFREVLGGISLGEERYVEHGRGAIEEQVKRAAAGGERMKEATRCQ